MRPKPRAKTFATPCVRRAVALPGWSGATAYNRGQVLYRGGRVAPGSAASSLSVEVQAAEGGRVTAARTAVDAAIDRWVGTPGWNRQVRGRIAGSTNPVAGPYFDFSLPEPTGVVGIIAPQESSLLGLVGVLAPPIACGNTVVMLASQDRPLPAISLAEVLATSDVPAASWSMC
jgi:acyl-CoA reductase-like NAD-dependent aldehyde dehydrogenase